MEAGYIPAGQYHIEIHQGRNIIGEYSFFVAVYPEDPFGSLEIREVPHLLALEVRA